MTVLPTLVFMTTRRWYPGQPYRLPSDWWTAQLMWPSTGLVDGIMGESEYNECYFAGLAS